MARILIVEDEESMRRILTVLLKEDGHEVVEADCLAQAEGLLNTVDVDLIMTDQRLPDGQGTTLIEQSQRIDPPLPVIMLTAYATVDLAVEAMRKGAFDFITKPFVPETVLAGVRRACGHGKLLQENARLKREVQQIEYGENEFLGGSAAMDRVRELVQRAAPTDATVLITGETGTGKELVARLIHGNSRRSREPFIAVNCAAMPEALLESQLFGHERGAFTGADRARKGLFEAAHGGTLFLDEAGEMPATLQAKLLRVLVDGRILRVGSTSPVGVDVRILAATHRDLHQRMKEGLFREDLFYRLAVVPIHIPPLRERMEDLEGLVAHFATLVASALGVAPRVVSREALDALRSYGFPGNVRELRNIMERAYILSRGDTILPDDLPLGFGDAARTRQDPPTNASIADQLPGNTDLRTFLEQTECRLLTRALEVSGGNQAEASRQLGISRSDMAYKLKKYDLRELVE